MCPVSPNGHESNIALAWRDQGPATTYDKILTVVNNRKNAAPLSGVSSMFAV